MIKVIFYKVNAKNSTLLDKIIDLMSGKIGYSHVEIYDSTNNMYFGISGRDGRSRHKSIDENNGNWTVMELLDYELTNTEIIHEMMNKKYDYLSIISFIIKFLYIDRVDKLICSSAASEILKYNGVTEVALYPCFRISPNLLFKLLSRSKNVRIRYN